MRHNRGGETLRAHLVCAWHLRPPFPHIFKSPLRAKLVGENKLRIASDMSNLNRNRLPTVRLLGQLSLDFCDTSPRASFVLITPG